MIRVREGEEERLFTLEEFEARARRGEVSPHAWVCLPALTGERFVKARELPLFVALYDPRRVHFRQHFQVGRLPLLTAGLAVVCVALFLLSRHLGEGAVSRDALLLLGAKARARVIEDGEAWRLLMANLLHRDGVHLGFNLFALVNVGAVLEGVYRRGDYVLLLVVSGLATMGLSVVMSGPVTVGASGLVFGCLGCAVVFGWRFSDVLPVRYRLYFGGVVVGYAAVMFYLGLRSPSTDNWGHAGGLLAGVVMGALLQPRLLRLREAKEPLAVVVWPWALATLLVVATAAVGPLLPALLFRTEPYRVDAFGVILERPAHWTKAADPLGFLTFGNGVDALASLGCARLARASDLVQAERRFVDGELMALHHGGSIGDLRVEPATTGEIGGSAHLPARRVAFSFVAPDGPLEARAVLFARGQLECALVLAHRPTAPQGSRARLVEMEERLRIVPTRAQQQALELTRSRPGEARVWLELGLAHQTAGDVREAREAFEAALERAHGDRMRAQIQFARARLELDQGGDLDQALRAATEARELGGADELELTLVLIDVNLRLGRPDEAEAELARGRKEFGELEPLLERAKALADARGR